MSNFSRNAGIVLGQPTGKRIGITLVACALVLGIVLTTLPSLALTARAQGQMW